MAEPEYDVFLSYNSKDQADARAVVSVLEERHLSVFWDRGALRAGGRWFKELEEGLFSCRAIVVLVGPYGLGAWQELEVEVAISRQVAEAGVAVIPVLLRGAKRLSRFLERYTWVDLQNGVADVLAIDVLEASVRRVFSKEEAEAQARVVQELLCPYLGLHSFREVDTEYFFGRETFVDQLVKALEKSHLTGLVGPSGSGKSSIVHAGMIHRLRRQSGGDQAWAFALMRPTDQPLHAMAAALFSFVEPGISGLAKARELKALAKDLTDGTLDLTDVLESAQEKLGSSRLVLVIDQWEELYTLCRDDGYRFRFVAQLYDAMTKGQLSIVCTLRSDFGHRAFAEKELGERLESSLIDLHRMHAKDLRLAIEEPAKKVGLDFEAGLIGRIINDLGEEPGHLPLMEFVLTELWKRRDGVLLRNAVYEDLGGGRKALASWAEDVFNGLDTDDQAEVRRLFLQLVRPGEGTEDTRRRVNIEDLGKRGRKVMQALVNARLLTTHLDWEHKDNTEGSDDFAATSGTVEITHEALISHWTRLRTWLDDEREFIVWRERLRSDLSAWQDTRHETGFLLTWAPLAEAEEWFDDRPQDLNDAEREFIRLSLESRRKEEARKERLRKAVIVSLVSLVLIFFSFALLGFSRWRLSLSRALAAEAAELCDGPLDLALLLSLQAGNTADTVEARKSLVTLLEGNPLLKAFLPGHRSRISRVVFSPDGRVIASGGRDDIFLWEGETGNLLEPPLRGHHGEISSLAFSPDGNILASAGADGTIRLWRVPDHQPQRVEFKAPEPVRDLAISPDGRLLAASSHTSIYLWDFPSLQNGIEIPKAHASFISDLAFDRQGHLASAGTDGTIVLWDVVQRSKIRAFKGHQGQALSLAFHPSQEILASAGSDQVVRLWDIATGEEIGAPFGGHRDIVLSVAFSRDGKTLAAAGRDKVILLWQAKNDQWDLSNRQSSTRLVGHGKTIWSLAFGEKDHLVSGGDEDAAILWHLKAGPRFAYPAASVTGKVDSVAFAANGELLAAGGHDGAIRLWDTVAKQPRGRPLQGHVGAVTSLAFRGRTLISAGADGCVLLWDLDRLEREPRHLESLGGSSLSGIWSLALSSDGKLLAAGDQIGRVRLWNLASEGFLGEMSETQRGTVAGLSFSHDGRLLASGGQDAVVRIWNTQQRTLAVVLNGHDDAVTGVAFSFDDQLLVSGSVDRTVRLWDLKANREESESPLTGPEDSISGVAFADDGKTLAASSLDGRVYLWDVESHEPLGNGLLGEGEALNVAFQPGARHLASGNDNTVLLFDVQYGSWRPEACNAVGRNMTRAEWRKYLGWEPYRSTCGDVGFESLANRLDKARNRK